MVNVLREAGADFSSFDILEDEEVSWEVLLINADTCCLLFILKR